MDEDLTFLGASSPPADFIWITRPAPPEKKRPRIGVVLSLKEDPKGIWIERVVPESPAEKAGLLPEDQFIAVEGKEIKQEGDHFYNSAGGVEERFHSGASFSGGGMINGKD